MRTTFSGPAPVRGAIHSPVIGWARTVLMIAGFVGVALQGCQSAPRNPTAARPSPTPGPRGAEAAPRRPTDTNYAVIKVFYATDRTRVQSGTPANFFSGDRGTLSYGTCDVSIPRDHKMGELEAPTIWKLEFREDPGKHVVLLSVSPRAPAQYFTELGDRVRASPGKSLFIFIHGYNVSFEDAARRTAQIHYDLGFDGAPVFYSWPSQGKIGGYVVDEGNIEWTQANLKAFLTQVASSTDAANIYVIAHSMGNRALTAVIGPLLAAVPDLRTRLRQIILTAPDIDADVFKRDIAPQLAADHVPTTLYVSSRDLALRASKDFHGYPRAGDSSDGVVIVSGIDTIDASAVDTSFVGHSYYADERSVLGDIFYVVRNGFDPNNRFALVVVEGAAGRYWKFKE